MFDFKIPRDIENIITINLTILFFFAFFYMTYTDGKVTIKYLDNSVLMQKIINDNDTSFLSIDNNFYSDISPYRKYRDDLTKQQKYILIINFYLFFLFLPLINIIYGLWCFKKGFMWLPKPLYTRLYLQNNGCFKMQSLMPLKKSLKQLKEDKAGNIGMNAVVYAVIGILLVVVLIISVAPTAFSGSNNITGAPTWFNTVFPIIIAAAFILLMWRSVSGK